MLDAMQDAMPEPVLSIAPEMPRTNERTQRTNGRPTHLSETSSVPERAGEIERWVIRKRWSFMYGSPGWYWRVSHSTLPAYFGHSVHCYTFEDALVYACDHAAVAS